MEGPMPDPRDLAIAHGAYEEAVYDLRLAYERLLADADDAAREKYMQAVEAARATSECLRMLGRPREAS
jgi:hypothetical protein